MQLSRRASSRWTSALCMSKQGSCLALKLSPSWKPVFCFWVSTHLLHYLTLVNSPSYKSKTTSSLALSYTDVTESDHYLLTLHTSCLHSAVLETHPPYRSVCGNWAKITLFFCLQLGTCLSCDVPQLQSTLAKLHGCFRPSDSDFIWTCLEQDYSSRHRGTQTHSNEDIINNIHTRSFFLLQPEMPSALRLRGNQKGGLLVLHISGCFLRDCTQALWTSKPKPVRCIASIHRDIAAAVGAKLWGNSQAAAYAEIHYLLTTTKLNCVNIKKKQQQQTTFQLLFTPL